MPDIPYTRLIIIGLTFLVGHKSRTLTYYIGVSLSTALKQLCSVVTWLF